MRILVTNDDGIHTQGIRSLVQELKDIAEIYLVAPDRERSGTGHSITVFEPIKVVKTNYAGTVEAWVIAGTPVDCVKLALSKLIKKRIHLVVSGINHGANLGTDVLYSGTVSAAAEAVLMDVPAIAISLDSYEADINFGFAAHFTRRLVEMLAQKRLSCKNLININIPDLPEDKIKGVKVSKLGIRNYDNLFEERKDPRGNSYYWLGGGVAQNENEQQDCNCDVCSIQDGYISITPIHLDLTDYEFIEEFRSSNIDSLNSILREEHQ